MIYRLDSVTKVYPQGRARVRALHGVTLDVAPGEHPVIEAGGGAVALGGRGSCVLERHSFGFTR